MEDDGVFRVQLLLLPAQMETTQSSVNKQWFLGLHKLIMHVICLHDLLYEKKQTLWCQNKLYSICHLNECDNNNICF